MKYANFVKFCIIRTDIDTNIVKVLIFLQGYIFHILQHFI